MLPPLSIAALFGENLVGVVLRNVFGFHRSSGPSAVRPPPPAIANTRGSSSATQFCSPNPKSLQPKSRAVARGVNVREFH